MDVTALAAALRAADPGTILVPSRILRRVIKQHEKLPGIGLDVPHAHSYVVATDALFRIADEQEIGCAAASLPPIVVLVPRPEHDDPADLAAVTLRLWRASFHGSVHRALDAEVARGKLTLATVRARIHRIGQTEFDEARVVLRQDHLLLPSRHDHATYAEFAATYLELRAFAPDLLQRTFPALGNLAAIDETLALDVDATGLLAASRPDTAPKIGELAGSVSAALSRAHAHAHGGGADEPAPSTASPPLRPMEAELGEDLTSLVPDANAAEKRGNLVRAMLLRTRAIAVGSEKDPAEAERSVRADLQRLTDRLAAALGERRATPEAQRAWADALLPLVKAAPSASRLPWNTEARLLYDLQNACIDHERESFTVDVITWARSLFRRPIVRALPVQSEVRVVKRLRAALKKMPRTRVVEPERSAVAGLLRHFLERAEANLREAIRPRIEAALVAVGLLPESVPEQVAAMKVVGELVDAIVERGFISLGQLRDALSRNNLKMNNLSVRELFLGDAVLKADDVLSESLDGVYRRGEIYLRALQRLSALAFGTRAGRLLTLYVFLPLGGAFVGLEGLTHMIGAVMHYVFRSESELALLHWWSFVATAIAILALMHSAAVRRVTMSVLRALGSVVSAILFRGPRWLFTRPLVRRFFQSAPSVFLGRYLLKPLAITALGLPLLLWLELDRPVLVGVLVASFLAWDALLNSRPGVRMQEAAVDVVTRQFRELHQRVLPGIWALLVWFFRQLVDGVDRMIYAVDEYLRFHRGDGVATLVVKGTLGTVWFLLTYVIRIYVNLLIEPQVNPIKHFPVVTVAAKIMIPMMHETQQLMVHALQPAVGHGVARGIALPTTFFLPGFWGFLVWEFKENFKLYRMNRHAELGEVGIGHHGESMAAYLKPGLHSGTIPKLYTKLRRATRKGTRSALKHREALHHVEETISRFAERELVALLRASPRWTGGDVAVGHVAIASNRVQIDFERGAHEPHVRIAFEEQSGWLVGGVAEAGWLEALTDDERATFECALAGFYKMAGVDLVREQIEASLGAYGSEPPPYDISEDGLVVWPGGAYDAEIVYPFARGGVAPTAAKPVDTRSFFFRDESIGWAAWVLAWEAASAARVSRGAPLLPARRPETPGAAARMTAE